MLETNNDVKIDHVCAVITTYNSGGLIVVSRKGGEYGRLGMPGGKVEEGETPLQAIIREIEEEVGIIVCDPDDLFLAYTGPASLDDGYQENKICSTYVYKLRQDLKPAFINSEGCLVTVVKSFSLICKPDISPFYLYNQDVVKHCFIEPTDLLKEIEEDKKAYAQLEDRRDARQKHIEGMIQLLKSDRSVEFNEISNAWQNAENRNSMCLV